MAGDKQVGSLWCTDVLAVLSDYLDGELDARARADVEQHLAGCEECTRFGGEFGAVVRAVRSRLGVADVPAEVAARLDAALAKG
jgi:anti-sigma factor (TIGR02949 family)